VGDLDKVKAPPLRELTITPVVLMDDQRKKLKDKKYGLEVDDLTVRQISAQKAELKRLGIPALQIPLEDKASKSSPEVSPSPRSAPSPQHRDAKKSGASARQVLPETPRMASPGSKIQRMSTRTVPGRYEASTAMNDPAFERLQQLDHKLERTRMKITGLQYQLVAARDDLNALQQKRDKEVAALLSEPRPAFPPHASGDEGTDSDNISEIIQTLQEKDRRHQH
jgi:hypothetical protein